MGDRCFEQLRYCRKGDFRISGSRLWDFDPKLLDRKCIQSAFEVAKKLKTQSVAFDFILDNNEPKLVEVNYCFTEAA